MVSFFEKGPPPFHILFLLGFLAASHHPASVAVPPCRACFNRRILKGGCGDCHLAAALKKEFYDLSVNKPMYWLIIYMSDKISSFKTSLVGRATFFNTPDYVVHSVDIAVTHKHSDCLKSETKLFARTLYNDWLPWTE